jgi:hypothetical protein
MKRGVTVLAIVVTVTGHGQAQAQPQSHGTSCPHYLEGARDLIKPHVEALRIVEREAADRLKGLDTRTFHFLAGEARKAASMIGYPEALKAEEALGQCPDAVPPIRRICVDAAHTLASAIEGQETGAGKASRQAYADTMPRCEQLIGLPPLRTAWRTAAD